MSQKIQVPKTNSCFEKLCNFSNCISFPEVTCKGVKKKYLVFFGIFLQICHLVTAILPRNDGLTTVC